MYKSPIELLVSDIQNQIVKQQDEGIYKAFLHYVPIVDKEELIRALNYDRQQYQKGYLDGKTDAVAHGRWIDSYAVDSNGKKVYDSIDCSVCEEVYKIETHDREYWKGRFKQCFCCGAKMDEEP